MARMSNAEIERRATARALEISRLADERAEEKIQKMLPALMAGLAAQLGGMRPAPADGVPGVPGMGTGDTASMDALAHAITKASDPGNRRRIVPPAELKKREEAREAMFAKLLENHEKRIVPVYKIIQKTHLGDIIIDPEWKDENKRMRDQEVTWAGPPNQAMLPVDDAAKEVHNLYCVSIGIKPGYLMQINPITGDIQHVSAATLPAPWVQTAGQILRGRTGAERGLSPSDEAIPMAPSDPRRFGAGVPNGTTKRVFGTLADPVVMTR